MSYSPILVPCPPSPVEPSMRLMNKRADALIVFSGLQCHHHLPEPNCFDKRRRRANAFCQSFGRKARQWLAQVSGHKWVSSGKLPLHLLLGARAWGQPVALALVPSQGIHIPLGVESSLRSERWEHNSSAEQGRAPRDFRNAIYKDHNPLFCVFSSCQVYNYDLFLGMAKCSNHPHLYYYLRVVWLF